MTVVHPLTMNPHHHSRRCQSSGAGPRERPRGERRVERKLGREKTRTSEGPGHDLARTRLKEKLERGPGVVVGTSPTAGSRAMQERSPIGGKRMASLFQIRRALGQGVVLAAASAACGIVEDGNTPASGDGGAANTGGASAGGPNTGGVGA